MGYFFKILWEKLTFLFYLVFMVAYSLKIKPEAIDIRVIELNHKSIDKEDVIDLL